MKMPYTEALLHSIPKLEDPSHTRLNVIAGRPPDLVNPPKGCRFSRDARTCSTMPQGRTTVARTAEHPDTCTPAGTRSAPRCTTRPSERTRAEVAA